MSEYADKDVDELRKLIADKRESLRAFRFGGEGSRSRDTRQGRNLRKEIARLQTEINARTIPRQ